MLTSENIQSLKRRFYWLGSIQLIAGMLALAVPVAVSFSIELLVGVILLLTGAAQGWSAVTNFGDGEREGRTYQLLIAALAIIVGLFFIFNPLTGVVTLSVFLAAFLLVDGGVKIAEYFRLREVNGSLWLVFSGVLGIILALLILSNIWSGIAIMGIMLGIDLVFSGITLILAAKSCSVEKGTCGF